MSVSFIITWLLFLLVPVTSMDHEVQPININAGIFYELLYPVRFTRANWKLTTAIDISKIEEYRGQLEQSTTMRKLNQTCLSHWDVKKCNSWIQPRDLSKLLQKTDLYLSEIKEMSGDTTSTQRVKRTIPFGFIGTLSRSLFGTLNEEDAKYYDKEIDKLYSDTHKISTVLQNETHLIRAKVHQIESTIISIHQDLSQQIQNVGKTLKAEASQTKLLLFQQLINQCHLEMDLAIERYERTLAEIIDAILFLKNGQIHPGLLPMAELREIVKTYMQSQPDYVFPVALDQLQSGALYKISDLAIRYYSRKIIIEIDVPLLSRTPFNLYHLHPLPTHLPNHTGAVYVKPKRPFFIISSDREQYSWLDNEGPPHCKQAEDFDACIPQYPIYTSFANPTCELNILIHANSNPHKICDVKISNQFIPYWKQLRQHQGWIYSLPNTTELQLICGGVPTKSILLNGSGILQLDAGCTGKLPYGLLPGHKKLKSSYNRALRFEPVHPLQIDVLTTLNFSDNVIKNGTENTMGITFPDKNFDISLSELEDKFAELITHKRAEKSRDITSTIIFCTLGLIIFTNLLFVGRFHIWRYALTIWYFCKPVKRNENQKDTEMTSYAKLKQQDEATIDVNNSAQQESPDLTTKGVDIEAAHNVESKIN